MRAAVYERFGPPSVLRIQDLPEPVADGRHAVIRVHAASVNPKDVLMRKGRFARLARLAGGRRPPYRVGFDLAGMIETAATRGRMRAGERVMAMLPGWIGGACAERVAVADEHMAPLADHVEWGRAAATPLAASTALQALRDVARVRPGERVLVNGAAGGVGTFAVRIARLLGARVTAVAREANHALCTELGADEVIDYRSVASVDWARGIDVFFDVFGNRSRREARPILSRRGRYVTTIPSPRAFAMTAAAPWMRRPGRLVVVASRHRDLRTLAGWLASGELDPIIDSRFALDDLASAHARVETRHARGKVVIDVSG